MNPTKIEYPVFEANQVLTNEHLNQGFEYLDEQERLTRANLTGIGIVCGLEISVNNDKSVITITKGCGITSDGYLVVLPEKALGFYKDYVLKGLEYKSFLDPLDPAGKQHFDLWEITADATGAKALKKDEFSLDDKAVLLFVELNEEPLKDCSANNCNDKGAKVTATIRPLLIEKKNIPPYNPGLGGTSGELPALVRLPRPKKLTNGYTINDYMDELGEILDPDKQLKLLKNNLDAVYEKYNANYNVYESNPFNNFTNLFSNPKDVFIQYYYDFLLDVIQAYNELICFTASNPVCGCILDGNSFSRHLTLGSVIDGTPDGFRHVFTPVDRHDEARTKELRLYMRLVILTRQFQPDPLDPNIDNEIKITPSQYGDFPLAQKAIPYYYKPTPPIIKPSFAELWTTGKPCSGLAVATNSYHSTDKPLDTHLEAYNFFRIEGHIGQPNPGPDIQAMITGENLPFSALTINSSDFNTFAANHPGLAHGAGAPTGGTFIMVNDGSASASSTVIADFFLPYRVCEQKKCSKFWIIAFPVLIIILIGLMVKTCSPRLQTSFDRSLSQQSEELNNRQSGQIKGANDVQHWRENR